MTKLIICEGLVTSGSVAKKGAAQKKGPDTFFSKMYPAPFFASPGKEI
jgi:hypothetical protein